MEDSKFTSCVGLTVSTLIAVVITIIVDGWALCTIWNWFIPPIFGLTTLTIMQAVGVAMVFSLFTRTNKIKKQDANEYTGIMAIVYSFTESVLTGVFSVMLAWVVLQFAF